MSDIVITGKRLPDADSQVSYWLDFYRWRNGLPAVVFVADSGGGGGNGVPQPLEVVTYDVVIGATATMPKVELNDLTEEQLQEVLEFLSRVDNDPQMAAALQQMQDRNVTLRITFADDLPEPAHPTANATISWSLGVESDFKTQGFVPNTVVNLIIDRDKITNQTWEHTLEGIITHEFTHFYHDSDGLFLKDIYFGGAPGNSVQDFDDGAFNLLYGNSADSEMEGLRDAFENQRVLQPDGLGEEDSTNESSLTGDELFWYHPGPAGDLELIGIAYV